MLLFKKNNATLLVLLLSLVFLLFNHPLKYTHALDFQASTSSSSNIQETLFLIETNNKFGFANSNEDIIIPCIYDFAYEFSEGLACVRDCTNKYGFIDAKGNVVIDIKYHLARPFSNELAAVKVDGKFGYISKDGNFIISPTFNWCEDFKEEYAAVSIGDTYTYIDKKCNKIISEEAFDSNIYYYDTLPSFSEGLVQIKINNKFGYMDKKGDIVIRPIFDNANSFKNNIASVEMLGKWGFINKDGNFVIRPKFDYAGNFSEGLAPVKLYRKWYYITPKGEVSITPHSIGNYYTWYYEFHNRLALVNIDNKYGYINILGDFVIEPQFSDATFFFDKFARIEVYGGNGYICGYIDDKGKLIIGPYFNTFKG